MEKETFALALCALDGWYGQEEIDYKEIFTSKTLDADYKNYYH